MEKCHAFNAKALTKFLQYVSQCFFFYFTSLLNFILNFTYAMHDSFRFQISVILLCTWLRSHIKDMFCSALKLPGLCGISLVNQVSLVLELSRWRGRSETGVKTAWKPADFSWQFVEVILSSDTFSRKDMSISHDTKLTEPLVAFRLSSCAIRQIKPMLPCTISHYNAVSFSVQCKWATQAERPVFS